jgi:hypothetical protein
LVAAAAVLLLAVTATAEPRRLLSPTHCTTGGGDELQLDPGTVVVDAPDWLKLNDEVRRLQETETRLRAENQVFRQRASTTWRVVLVVSSAVVLGFGAGAAWERVR